MGNERLTLEIAAMTTGEASVDELATSIDRLAASSARAGSVGGGAGRQIGEGFSHSVPEIAAASASIREFEGAIPIRAVERFLTTTLGLGGALSAIFPIAGAYAFGEMILSTAAKYDPLIKAQAALSESNKKLDAEWKQLESRLEGLQARALTAQFGGKAGDSLRAFFSESDARSFDATAADKQRQIDTATIKLNTGKDASWMPGAIGSEMTKRNEAAEQAKITQLTNERDMAISQASAARQGAATDLLEQQAALLKTSEEKAKELQSRVDSYAKSGRDYGLSPFALAEQKKQDMLSQPGLTPAQIATINTSGDLEKTRAFQKSVDEFRKGHAGLVPVEESDNKELSASFTNSLREAIRSGEADSEGFRKAAALAKDQDSVRIRGVDDTAERQAKIAGADSKLDPMVAAQRQLDIRKQAIVADAAILDLSKGSYDQEEKRNALMQKASDIQSEFNYKLDQQVAKQEELFKSLSGSLYDSFFSGGKGISSFFKSQAEGIGKTVFQNVAKFAEPSIMAAIPHATGRLGQILQGTPFGPKAGMSPLQIATQANTDATTANTMALQGRAVAVPGALPGGLSTSASTWPSIASLGGNPLSGMMPSLPGAFDNPTGNPDTITEIDPNQSYGTATPNYSSALPKIGTPTGDLMAGAAAITGVIAGIKAFGGSGSGGVQGKLDGVGGILASASVVTSLIKGVASSIPIIGSIVAATLPLIGSLFPNGPQARENQIWKETTQAQYFAPTALNETMSTNGNYLSSDMRGNLIQTGFSAHPQVTDPYLYWGPNNTPITAPGSVTSPYSPQPQPPTVVINHNYAPGSIQTMDQSSFHEFAVAHHAAVGEAARVNIGQGDSALMQKIRYNVGGR